MSISYKLKFKFKIHGCEIREIIKDKDMLEFLSDEHNTVTEIFFICDENNTTFFSGEVESKDLFDGYRFISFNLKTKIIKLLLLTDIDCLDFQDSCEIFIKNKEELKLSNKQIIPYYNLYGTVVPTAKYIDKENLKNAMKIIINVNKKYEEVLFWLYMANTVVNVDKGITQFDDIIRYRLLWTAFNSLYNIRCRNKKYKSEKFKIEKFAREDFVLDYFKSMDADKRSCLYDLVKSHLYLSYKDKNVNISNKLENSLNNNLNEDIAKYSLLCLYSLRNALLHGNSVNLLCLSRKAYILLKPLVINALFYFNQNIYLAQNRKYKELKK